MAPFATAHSSTGVLSVMALVTSIDADRARDSTGISPCRLPITRLLARNNFRIVTREKPDCKSREVGILNMVESPRPTQGLRLLLAVHMPL